MPLTWQKPVFREGCLMCHRGEPIYCPECSGLLLHKEGWRNLLWCGECGKIYASFVQNKPVPEWGVLKEMEVLNRGA